MTYSNSVYLEDNTVYWQDNKQIIEEYINLMEKQLVTVKVIRAGVILTCRVYGGL